MSRVTDLIAIEYIAQIHCTDPTCQKCSARVAAGCAARHGVPARPHTRKNSTEGSDAPMTVTIPLVAIVGLIVFIAYRYMGLRVWHALVCAALRFPARRHQRRTANQPRTRRNRRMVPALMELQSNRKG